jgi:hypothetical protein
LDSLGESEFEQQQGGLINGYGFIKTFLIKKKREIEKKHKRKFTSIFVLLRRGFKRT